jgi:hypothetical protein
MPRIIRDLCNTLRRFVILFAWTALCLLPRLGIAQNLSFVTPIYLSPQQQAQGGFGCFNFNGGSILDAWRLTPKRDVAGEFGGAHAGSVSATNLSLTTMTYPKAM